MISNKKQPNNTYNVNNHVFKGNMPLNSNNYNNIINNQNNIDNKENISITKESISSKLKNKRITKKLANTIHKKCSNSEEESVKKYMIKAYNCNEDIVIHGNEYMNIPNYCNTNICINCLNRKIFNKVSKNYPFVKEWYHCNHITITRKAIKKRYLLTRVKEMIKAFSKINRKLKYQNQRKEMLRNIYIGYDYNKKTFNPHIHILANYTQEEAEFIIQMWMDSFRGLKRENQKITGCDNRKKKLWYILTPHWLKYYKKEEKFDAWMVKHIIKTFRNAGQMFQKYGYTYSEEKTEQYKKNAFQNKDKNETEINITDGYYNYDKDINDYVEMDTGIVLGESIENQNKSENKSNTLPDNTINSLTNKSNTLNPNRWNRNSTSRRRNYKSNFPRDNKISYKSSTNNDFRPYSKKYINSNRISRNKPGNYIKFVDTKSRASPP